MSSLSLNLFKFQNLKKKKEEETNQFSRNVYFVYKNNSSGSAPVTDLSTTQVVIVYYK